MENYYDIRGGSGLGDAIYINSIVQELLKKWPKIVLRTRYPGVFRFLPIETKPFTKGGENLAFNYGGGARKRQTTNLYQDLLLAAGLNSELEMNTKWEWLQSELCDNVLKNTKGRKVLLVSTPHHPFGRDDGRGNLMIPNWKKFDVLLSWAKDNNYYIIQVGTGKKLYNFKHVDYDVSNQTSIADVMNFGMKADLCIGQCGFILPLAKGFKKPYFIILAKQGLGAKDDWFISCLTLEKLFSKKDCFCGGAIDSENDQVILEKFKNDCRL